MIEILIRCDLCHTIVENKDDVWKYKITEGSVEIVVDVCPLCKEKLLAYHKNKEDETDVES